MYENTVFCGEASEILAKEVPDNEVKVCYADPPFYSKKDYVGYDTKDSTEYRFTDRWKSVGKYIETMESVIREIKRVLRSDGTFYLHCDLSALFWLKSVCDTVFGENSFLNMLVWKRHGGNKNTTRNYPKSSDFILMYKVSDGYTFHQQYKDTVAEGWKYNIYKGKWVAAQSLTAPSRNPGYRRFKWKKRTPPKTRMWRYSKEKLEQLFSEGKIRLRKDGKVFARGLIVEEDKPPKVKVTNIWNDIPGFKGGMREYTGYPTQKPLKLLHRVIKASSNEGDVILDPFCGSGTSLLAASMLRRKYIGIDIYPEACRKSRERIEEFISGNADFGARMP